MEFNTCLLPSSNSSTLLSFAKNLVLKHPGIYKGNLVYWIKDKFPEAKKIEIELVFVEMLQAGYFFNMSDRVYPPNKIDKKEKDLMKSKPLLNLSKIDLGIIYELEKAKRNIYQLNELSRIVLSKNWHGNEQEIKIKIQHLFLNKIIIAKQDGLSVDWELIRRALYGKNSI